MIGYSLNNNDMKYTSKNDILLDASRVLMEEARAIQACAERLQQHTETRQGYEHAVELIFKSLEAGGKVVVTGVGKSGKIGEKIVATMLSTGTSATFLHPVEALHGDLGVIQVNDVVLALSFSGNTEELMALLPSIKHRQVPIIGLGGNEKSKLAKECQAWLDGHVDREAGTVPAPTSSTTLALALGDALALSLAKLRSFSTDGFALNHPGGSLGRRLLLKVSDTMITTSVAGSVSPQASLDLVIMEMTRHPKASGVVVIDNDDEDMTMIPTPPCSTTSEDDSTDGQVVGVITHGDIHRILKSSDKDGIFNIRAADIMTRNPITCQSNTLALDALQLMTNKSLREKSLPLLPVLTKSGRWQGVVTLKDLQEFF
ncbi:uncharacterized protein BX664DRAFT_334926 [Halteromyces radiatus]|uniref:uncharacterized protein n=1 Tax=Halteromyces radiatus TaxID=101107 RepID=UPI00221FFB6F|nr:uncharacterized protein BX664DRAFT_334926 [Halteromyces radiatus]KAI8086107.1 hypothetical protein BX664DRAFT_334926 [Halteromyces radiatus]